MPAWGPFLAVTLLILVLLLVFARLSQDVLEEYGPPQEERSETTQTDQQETTQTERSVRADMAETQEPSDKPQASTDGTPASVDKPSEARDDSPPSTEATSSTSHEGRQFEPADVHPPGGDTAASDGVASTEQSLEEPFGTPPEEHQSREPAEEITLTPQVLMANVAFTQLLVVIVLVLAAWYFEIPAAAFGITADAMSTGLPAVAIGVVFGAVLWVANELSTTLADAVGASYDEQVREMLAPESVQGWILLFVGVLPLISVGEELLFRAALIGVPEAGYGLNVWLLALGSSVAFALGHGAQGRVGVVVTGALGFVLAAGYIVTGSLLVVVVAHYVINALEFYVHEYLGFEGFSPEAIGL